MSQEVFPLEDLVGLDIEIERETIYSTKVYTSASGKETRATWWSTPRYRYTIAVNVLRRTGYLPEMVEDDVEILQGFFDRHRGAYDSFLLDDPVDGEQRRVRFVDDVLTLRRINALLYDGEKIEMVSLK